MNRKATILLISTMLILFALQTAARSPQGDNSIDTFWMKFKVAVINATKAPSRK
jgi:hypothetical protein